MRLIDADAVLEELKRMEVEMMPAKLAHIYTAVVVEDAPTIDAVPRWIPCEERLPNDDEDVLISYCHKEGEGNTSHVYIDITSYGQMYFGGNRVGDYKHWRAPFEYFESNYEVIAWMPLPEPYGERRDDEIV